ncbi:FAD-dependent oxidoreductase [Echinicola marina]|nr:FAD-dependent oxidoreductase [Echinicola marina]
MEIGTASKEKRNTHRVNMEPDLVIAGGGLAGTCCAITAAREGLKVCLVQDRPVLGGNASSEVRLWILGATSHMGNNNRWAREGGVIDEILVENLYRNPEGNPIILDTILLEKVTEENNITLLLNTCVHELEKKEGDQIDFIRAFCSQNSTEYVLRAPLYVDATGDGLLGFLAGAAFRMGAEIKEEFGELFAPDASYGELLGHSIYFYTKDVGRPVKYMAPSFAKKDITELPRFKTFNLREDGCRLWWVEYGGRSNTILASEEIKWELWRIVYGIWNHVKNSGEYDGVENLTLEWVGTVPGKRESRRFEGDYIMTQRDVVEQREHFDAVSFGGWALDLHPADGVYSQNPGCTQWHSKGVYQIPFRSMYSRNIKNLFLGGRLLSASHVAFGSTRVMATCAHNGQALGMAAKICREKSILPHEIIPKDHLSSLQDSLLATGHYIPNKPLGNERNVLSSAHLTVSSEYALKGLPFDGPWKPLEFSIGQLLPFEQIKIPAMNFRVRASQATVLEVELRKSSKAGNFTPDEVIAKQQVQLVAGEQCVTLDFDYENTTSQYLFVCLMANDVLEVKCSNSRLTGVLSISNKYNKSVATSSLQSPPENIGIDQFEFWVPERRPKGHNLAFELEVPLKPFGAINILPGVFRPTTKVNAWVASLNDANPTLQIAWKEKQSIKELKLFFDTDYDHPMESTLMGHPESEIPFCVKSYRILDKRGEILYQKEDNHQTVNTIRFDGLELDQLTIELDHPSKDVPAALFGLIAQ